MASGTGILFSFSAVLFLSLLLLQAPPAPVLAAADLVASALDRLLDGRGALELMATRRNMILLCHAILLLILRDAGVLGGAPARRRSRTPPAEATAMPAAAGTEIIACTAAASPVPAARPHDVTRSAVVVWRRRRPRNRAVAPVHDHDDGADRGVDVECRPAVETAATGAAAPVQTTGPPAAQPEEEAAAAVATRQIVVAEPPRNDDDDGLLDRHDRAAAVVEPLERPPTAIAADDGERDDCDDDRRLVAVADDDTAREEAAAGVEMELADDRTFEEFIESQRRQMRQESLRLQRLSSRYHYQATATCY